MFRLQKLIGNWRQAVALFIVWGALAGSAALCLFAQLSQMSQGGASPPGGHFAAIVISLASRAF